MATFDWSKICSQLRVGPGQMSYPQEQGSNDLSVAEKDAERILTNSSFRRLQGKTQVYPLPGNDFVRNRLTHTLEVAHIGASMTRLIFEGQGCPPKESAAAPQLVYNGCLLHDIGNPPFGHSGESSIREFFEANQLGIPIVEWAMTNDHHRSDLTLFDGNAQGFRIATRLAGWKHSGGMRLCAGSLTSMVKYPFSSKAKRAQDKGKFGYMATEQAYALELFETCGLVDSVSETVYRNPLSLIVEAADDIAYLTSDVQDAHRYGDLPFELVSTLLKDLSRQEHRPSYKELQDSNKGNEEAAESEINYLRAAAVSRMIVAASDVLRRVVFDNQIQTPGKKKFEFWSNPLVGTEYTELASKERRIREVCDNLIYRGVKKVTMQITGGRIIKFVLESQLRAISEIYCALYEYIAECEDGGRTAPLHTGSKLPELVAHAVKKVKVSKAVSHDSAQVLWSMPNSARDSVFRLLMRAFKPDGGGERLRKDDPSIAYELVQISLDFVSGTTDKYISDYSKSLGGPTVT